MTPTQQNYLGCLVLLLVGIAMGPLFDDEAQNESRLAELKAGLAAAHYPVKIGKTSLMTGADVTDDRVLVTHYVETGKRAAEVTDEERAAIEKSGVSGVCQNREMIENFLFLKAYRQEWRDADGQTIVDVTVTPERCLKR